MKKAYLGVGNGIRLALAAAAISLAGSLPATAANLFWSADGSTQGGTGNWTGANHFGSSAGGPFTTTWNNANVDSAEFGGAAGTVSLGGNVTVNTITLDLAGFIFASGSTITFSGANAGVNANYSSGTGTLSGVYTGTSLTKTGAGRLELNASTNTIGKYILNAGFVAFASNNRFGTAPGSLVSDYFTFNGGGLGSSGATGTTGTLGTTRGVTILTNGAFLGSSNGANVMEIQAPIVGTNGGGLTVTGSGPFYAPVASAGVWILSNTSNSWNGATTVALGTLRLGASEVIPNASAVSLTGGTLDLNGFNETVGTVQVNSSASTIIGSGVLTGTSYDLRASGAITAVLGGSGVAATKTTSGVVTLNPANTFDGGFNLNAGTVRVGNAASLGAANSAVTIAGGTLATNGATGKTLTYAYTVNGNFILGDATGTAAVTMAGTMDLGGGTRQITVNNATDTISAPISNGGLTKAGSGILVLSAVSTYTGATTINAGTISIPGTLSTIGDGTGALVLAGGTLNTSASRTIATNAVANPISLTADSAITTTSSATTVNLAFTTNSLSGTAGKVLTFRNDGANDATDFFKPRFMGSGFNFSNDMVVDNGTTGKTELDFANLTGTSQTFSGKISGTGSLNRTSGNVGSGNGGDTILTGNNTYSGGTTIEEGKLFANNATGSATGSGAVTVGATGTLAGTGAVSGPVTVNGTLSPGASIQSLGTGEVTFNAGSKFVYELNSTSVTADLLDSTGGITLATTGSGVALDASDLGAGFLNGGTKFTMIAYNGTLTGTFAGIADLSYLDIGTHTFRIRYHDTSAGVNTFAGDNLNDNNGFVTLTAVPELGSFLTMGLVGCCALGAVRLGKRFGFKAMCL